MRTIRPAHSIPMSCHTASANASRNNNFGEWLGRSKPRLPALRQSVLELISEPKLFDGAINRFNHLKAVPTEVVRRVLNIRLGLLQRGNSASNCCLIHRRFCAPNTKHVSNRQCAKSGCRQCCTTLFVHSCLRRSPSWRHYPTPRMQRSVSNLKKKSDWHAALGRTRSGPFLQSAARSLNVAFGPTCPALSN
jgi:hypothetical protein